MNSSGSAMKENEAHIDSLQGHLSKLNSAWQELAKNTVNSNFVKGLLDVGTALIKITDAVGGLPTVLATATSALLLFKGGLVLDTVFKAFTSGISSIYGGITNLTFVLPNAVAAFKAYSAGIISANTAIQAAAPLLAIVSLAITGVTIGIKSLVKAQEEANQAAIDSANEKLKEAEAYNDKISKQKDAIAKLQEEKAALESLSTQDDGTTQKIENKQKEIDKRQENIDKIKEEQKQASLKALGEVSGQKGSTVGAFKQGLDITFNEPTKAAKEARAGLAEINKELNEASGNTGKYNRILEEQQTKYSNLLAQQKKNNENYKYTEIILQSLGREIEENSSKYEKDAQLAKVYYEALKNGVSEAEAGQEMVDWMQEFLGLNDEQIQQVTQGTDVIAQNEEAKKNNTQATAEMTEEQKELKEVLDSAQEGIRTLNEEIDTLQESYKTLTSAVDEYNSNGYLSIDTLQSLLNLDNEYLSMLSLQNGQLVLNTTALDQKTDALIAAKVQELEAAAATDLYNLAQGNAEKMSSLAKSAIANAGSSAEITGNQFQSAVPGIVSFTDAMLKAKAAAGEASDPTQFETDANKIIDAYKNAYKSITALGATTTRAGGASGTKHTYTGKSKKSGSSSKGKTSKKDSKKTQEEYKAEIDTLYQYENALDNAKDEVDRLKDALSDTDSYDEQERYINQLIAALNNQIAKTQELKNAQSGQIQDYINQLRAQGFAIDYNAEKNELYINNMQHLADFSGDSAKSIEKIIKKIQDLNSNNRTLDGSVRDLTGSVKDYYDQLADIPEKKLEKFNDLMKEFQQSQLDAVQDQIDDLKREMEKDPRLAALEKEIEALEKQNDTIDKQKEMEEKLLAVEEARQKLENAKKNRTLQVYRERSRVRMGS